jgi:DNA-binding Xre family transcriptional regulator
MKKVKSNLKAVLKEKELSIRQLAEQTGLSFETLRRMYHDQTRQYNRDMLAKVCESLEININELLLLVDEQD